MCGIVTPVTIISSFEFVKDVHRSSPNSRYNSGVCDLRLSNRLFSTFESE